MDEKDSECGRPGAGVIDWLCDDIVKVKVWCIESNEEVDGLPLRNREGLGGFYINDGK